MLTVPPVLWPRVGTMNHGVPLPLEQPETTIPAAGGSLVRRSVLPSGVRILSEAVPGARSATIGFWVAAGSRDERAGRSASGSEPAVPSNVGSTHFLEHLLFKGTRTRSALDIAVAFDSVGGEHNALTAKEYTCYYAKIQDRDLPMAVEVIADMVTSSLIDQDEFETERGVILEELAMADDDPADVAGERLFEAVFGDHALGRPIGGTAATIGEAPARRSGPTTVPPTARATSSSPLPEPSTTTLSSVCSRASSPRTAGTSALRRPRSSVESGVPPCTPAAARSRWSTVRPSRPTSSSASPAWLPATTAA
ncbi:Protease 3 precursor [Rathayibacter tanaceti]|uniref:Protease 3 n=1 Tax=Rathayibacter tanaceti TaxID=1671680 RepID=A0A166IMS1_9MICO|nr:Protease 3 precursor [Rathayibacter tanaceti]